MNRSAYCRAGILALVLFAAACETRVTEVVLVPVSTLDVSPSSISVRAGSLDTVVATPRDDRGNVISVPRQVTFTSDDPSVASVRALDGLTAEVRGVAPGTATIRASLDGASGSASVTTSAAHCTLGDVEGTIGLNQSVSGALSAGDCILADGSHADIYQLNMPDSRGVQIRMASNQIDTYLLLVDTSGSPVAEDDDGGGGTDSQITITLAATTYYIVATSFDAGEIGQYTLSVQSQ